MMSAARGPKIPISQVSSVSSVRLDRRGFTNFATSSFQAAHTALGTSTRNDSSIAKTETSAMIFPLFVSATP
jgi:hypothetical protein